MPPSKGVPSGPWISASQAKRSSSLTGPAVIPSGGDVRRDLYSEKRRFDATLEAIFLLRVVQPGVEGGLGRRGREMTVEDGIARETLMCTNVLWGAGVLQGCSCNDGRLELNPKRKVSYLIRDIYFSILQCAI
jgi:hypothetical protein